MSATSVILLSLLVGTIINYTDPQKGLINYFNLRPSSGSLPGTILLAIAGAFFGNFLANTFLNQLTQISYIVPLCLAISGSIGFMLAGKFIRKEVEII